MPAKRKKDISKAEGPYFYEPLLQMGQGTRFTVRIIIKVWLVVYVFTTATLLISDIPWLSWLGALNALYLVDRLLHYNQPDSNIPKDGGGGNVADYITPRAKRAIVLAYDRASLLGGGVILHIAKVLVDTAPIQELLTRLEVDRDEFVTKLDARILGDAAKKRNRQELINKVEALALTAYAGRGRYQRFIDRVDLFTSLGDVGDESFSTLMGLFEINKGGLNHAAVFARLRRKTIFSLRRLKQLSMLLPKPRRPRHRIMNRAWTARPTPTLDMFSTDFTDMARSMSIGFLIGHQDIYTRLIDIVSRSTKPNAMLVGEAGIGKQAIIEYLASQIVRDQVPEELFDKRLVKIDIGGIVANADQAELHGRLRKIFDEIYRAGNVILFIPNIHNLTQTGAYGEMTAASGILPLIASNDFPTIGSTSPREFKKLIEPNSLFKEAFDTIRVNEITPEDAELILTYRSLILEQEFKVKITYEAIQTAVGLAKKYFHEKPLPSSADSLLKESLSYIKNNEGKLLRSTDIITVAEKRVNIPIRDVDSGEADKLLHMEELIHKRLINQEEAVKFVSNSLREYRSGLARKGGPIGSFLFVGPTGVGKTELAKTLSEIQFGSEDAMVRFDMSEYQEDESINRFIGSPDGKISGALTDVILERPYSLILLDEFEKANKDILKLFLQVFDDGRLTDNLGRTVSFENTIIIATSNAEAEFIVEELRIGKTMGDISEELRRKLIKHFSPELMNRFSSVVVFKSLSEENIRAIARLQLTGFVNQLKQSNNITLTIDDEIVNTIAKMGYDPLFGARPLQRTISEKLRTPLSKKILSGEVKPGMTIYARIKNGILYTYATS